MRNRDLAKLGAKWQKILRIQDWNISYCFAHRTDIDGYIARSNIISHDKIAKIEVGYIDEQDANFQDIESNLLHELIHVLFLELDSADDFEVGNNLVVDALLRFDRRK